LTETALKKITGLVGKKENIPTRKCS